MGKGFKSFSLETEALQVLSSKRVQICLCIQKPRETDGVCAICPQINFDILSKNLSAGQSLLKKLTPSFVEFCGETIYCS